MTDDSATDVLVSAQSAFESLLADGTNNKGDIPAEYNLNSGRHRAYVTDSGGTTQRVVNRTDLNGASGLVKLGNTSSFNDLKKGWDLSPAAGEIVEFGSAERFRYVPGYEFAYGVLTVFANAGDGLRPGQELIIRYGVPGDGYFIRYRHSEDGEHDVHLRKGGSVVDNSVKSDSEWSLDPFSDSSDDEQASLTRPLMHRGEFVHYGGGQFKPELSFLGEDGRQLNRTLCRTGNYDDIATDEVNGHIRVIYDCSDSAQGGSCVVGDIQAQVHGQVSEVDRTPPHRARDLGTGTNYTADTWQVVALARKDLDRQNVSVDFSRLGFRPTQGAELAVLTVPKETITWPSSGDWFTPAPSDPQDTVVEWAIAPTAERTNYPTRTIDPPNLDAETVIEGEALEYLEVQDTSQGNESQIGTDQDVVKAKLHDDEYAVFAVRFDGSSGSIDYMLSMTREDF